MVRFFTYHRRVLILKGLRIKVIGTILLGDNDAFENQIAVDIEIVDVKGNDIEVVGLKADNNLGDILEGNKEVSK